MSAIEFHNYTMLRIKNSKSVEEQKELALRYFLYDAELLQNEWREQHGQSQCKAAREAQ